MQTESQILNRELPPNLGHGLEILMHLNLGDCQLKGIIPPSLVSLVSGARYCLLSISALQSTCVDQFTYTATK